MAAFGYYTLQYLKHPVISPDQFFALIRQFHLPHVQDFASFAGEFEFLLRRLDPRYFKYKKDSRIQRFLDSLAEKDDTLSLEALGLSTEDIVSNVDLGESTFGFDLFRRVSVERNW